MHDILTHRTFRAILGFSATEAPLYNGIQSQRAQLSLVSYSTFLGAVGVGHMFGHLAGAQLCSLYCGDSLLVRFPRFCTISTFLSDNNAEATIPLN